MRSRQRSSSAILEAILAVVFVGSWALVYLRDRAREWLRSTR